MKSTDSCPSKDRGCKVIARRYKKSLPLRFAVGEEQQILPPANCWDIMAILEDDGTLRYLSPSVERVLGYRPEDLVAKSAFDYVHPENIEIVSSSFAKVLKNSGVRPPMEFRVRARGARVRRAARATAVARRRPPAFRGTLR